MVNIKNINFKDGSVSKEDLKLDHKKSSDLLTSFSLRSYLGNARSATARVKEMSEISGTTAKPHSQKGTGRARQGSRRSVQFRGGRTCFGPKGQIFAFDLPKKMKSKALADVLFQKIEDNKLLLLSNIEMEQPKTKNVAKFVKDNEIDNSIFLYDGESDSNKNFIKSAQNIQNFHCKKLESLNIYDLLSFENIILQKEVFGKIDKYFKTQTS